MTFWGWFGLVLVVLIILLAGCQAPKSFSATCALVVIGQNEQQITFVKQHCELE